MVQVQPCPLIEKEKDARGAPFFDNWDTCKFKGLEKYKNLIHVIRGQQVMLDSDLAMLYHLETYNLNKAMKRNVDRFPEDFCFQLTKEEYRNLIFQSGISSLQESENKHGGRY